MKMRRTLPHNLLVSECISQLCFHVRVREREREEEGEGVCSNVYTLHILLPLFLVIIFLTEFHVFVSSYMSAA